MTFASATSERGPVLTTERLRLRRWSADDDAPFAALNADAEVMRHFRSVLSRAESDQLIERIEAQFERRGYGLWAVERIADAAFLGFTGLADQTFDAPFTPCVEVGWRFARHAWGHGYATEAAEAALVYGFECVGLDEIVSITSPLNVRSIRVMERLGMTRDPADDFDLVGLPEGHPLRPHILYRLQRPVWAIGSAR